MRNALWIGLSLGTILLASCHKNSVSTSDFKSALNDYYASRQECLWGQAMKFPAQADANNESQTAQFDALTDAGLLNRTPAEKQRFLIGSKRVNNYDLSDKGRSDWTADPSQPGYGNFCLGNPTVKSIDQYQPNNVPDAAQYMVDYHYSVSVPDWANSTELKTAFPRIANSSEGQQAQAKLEKTPSGWQVENVSNLGTGTGAGIVQ